MPEIKWQCPGKNQCRCALRFIVFSYSRNDYSKDSCMYDRDPGELLVVLVICHCVNTTEWWMETARIWSRKMVMKLMQVWVQS